MTRVIEATEAGRGEIIEDSEISKKYLSWYMKKSPSKEETWFFAIEECASSNQGRSVKTISQSWHNSFVALWGRYSKPYWQWMWQVIQTISVMRGWFVHWRLTVSRWLWENFMWTRNDHFCKGEIICIWVIREELLANYVVPHSVWLSLKSWCCSEQKN